LSVYHSFHDEVALAQNHVWMCDGKCGNQPPFYGVIKRARNAPPTEQDFWFAKHKKVCGGSFVKVLEPAVAVKGKVEPKKDLKGQQSLDNFILHRKRSVLDFEE